MRKYTIYVHYDGRVYIENIKAQNYAAADNIALTTGHKLSRHGELWFERCYTRTGWRGDKLGVVFHTPREEEEALEEIDPVKGLIAQGVSEEAARFIVYGPETDNDECPDLE